MDWHISILKQDKSGLTVDELAGTVTELRKKLNEWFGENISGKEHRFYLAVTHRVSARQQRMKITKDGKTYRVDITGTLGTLEQGVKAMKDQLTAQWRAITEWRP